VLVGDRERDRARPPANFENHRLLDLPDPLWARSTMICVCTHASPRRIEQNFTRRGV
jgi:hypothetical protein